MSLYTKRVAVMTKLLENLAIEFPIIPMVPGYSEGEILLKLLYSGNVSVDSCGEDDDQYSEMKKIVADKGFKELFLDACKEKRYERRNTKKFKECARLLVECGVIPFKDWGEGTGFLDYVLEHWI